MTGAGSAEVAFAVEDSFETLPGTPTWYQPGENISVGSASLDRALTRARQPDDPRPDGSREGNREVALSVSFEMTDTNFHDLIFPASAPVGLAQSAQLAPTATWYLASESPSATNERFVQGAAVESVSWTYTQGEPFSVDLTIIGVEGDTSALTTPGTIVQPAKDDIVNFSGVDFDLNASQLSTKLQSLTLEVSGMARFRRGQQQDPVDAVVGAYEPSLTVEAIYEDGTQTELAYGTSGATVPQDTVDSSSGTLTAANPAGTVAEYNLSGLQPTSHDWADLVSADTDITAPTEYHVTDVTVA